MGTDLGLVYSYEAREIIIINEEKTSELIEKRAKDYTVHNFLKSTLGVEFDFLKMDNDAAVAAGFNNTKYSVLTQDLRLKFDASLSKIGLKFDGNGNGAMAKSNDAKISDLELEAIKKDITDSIKLFDVDLLSIDTKLSEIKSTLTSVVQIFNSTIKSQDEKDTKTITEKEKKSQNTKIRLQK